MDITAPLIFLAIFLLASISLFLVYKYGIKKKSYEEVLAEQRRQNSALLGPSKPTKLKEKKINKKAAKKLNKEKQASLVTSENLDITSSEDVAVKVASKKLSKIHVEFKEEPEEVEEVAVEEKEVKESSKKRSKKVKPILVKKTLDKKIDNVVEAVPVENHFEEIYPKDEFELLRCNTEAKILEQEETVQKPETLKEEKKKKRSKQPAEHAQTVEEPENVITDSSAPAPPQDAAVTVKEPKEKKKKKSEPRPPLTSDRDQLIRSVRNAELSRTEVQLLIDLLLDKQLEAPAIIDDWSEGKSDPIQKLKKQLADKEKQLNDEQDALYAIQAKLKEVRNEQSQERAQSQGPVEIRSKAQSFADQAIKTQMEVFKSWGVVGDWEHRYETKSVPYVENQLKQFLLLYNKGVIYRDVKPIYWSPSSRTALAEAELEYNENHISPSVYVRVLVNSIPTMPNLSDKRVYAVIWTTTPWTLPCNQAVSYNNTLSYCLIKKPDPEDKDLYIIATELLDSFNKETNCEYQLLGVHSGDMLSGATYIHPIYKDLTCKFLHSSHATNTKGTGLVHTAPAHGPEDFLVGIQNKIDIVDLVNEAGCYKVEAGAQFAGKYVLTEGNQAVIEYVKEDLLGRAEIRHSYPYDWRTKQPVIIKASKQWFVDTDQIKNKAVKVLENDVTVLPIDRSEVYKNALISQLQKRPYWCISRQRKWGVPIPVFYSKNTEEALITEDTIEHLCSKLRSSGSDFWWTSPVEELLPPTYSQRSEEYIKGEDILDIWFDSGISWSQVLKGNQIADLYLEGVDQFQGWFQSSLITSVALRGCAPYKTIFVHGFAVDKNGVKMSKSLGNVVDPVEVVAGGKNNKPYGVDVLRWWVACHANHIAMASVSDNILQQVKEEVQKVRSTLRFCVAALSDYKYNPEGFQHTRLADRYVLHLLAGFYQQAKIHIENHTFHKINTSLIPFLTNQISALYFTSIKDRLYCQPANHPSRSSALYTLHHLFYTISKVVGGVLPHLVEECHAHLSGAARFFATQHPEPQHNWIDQDLAKFVDVILEVRKEVNRVCEAGTSLSTDVILQLPEEAYNQFQCYVKDYPNLDTDLKDILQVASVQVTEGQFKVVTSQSDKSSCPRCRLVQSSVADTPCARCQKVLDEFYANKRAVVG